ncbi:hypothetical protein F4801DRAFT_168283 [Xylaria longipes]|nr:hypothetical protein F4801DRAFT_168283 [Xylaria longipes]
MPAFSVYLTVAVILAALSAPMAMISKLFTLLLFTSAPLIARATSDGAPYVVIDVLGEFVSLVIILALVVFIRVVDAYLNLRGLPVQFFELLGSL